MTQQTNGDWSRTGERDAKEIPKDIHHFPQFNYEPLSYLLKITKEKHEKKFM